MHTISRLANSKKFNIFKNDPAFSTISLSMQYIAGLILKDPIANAAKIKRSLIKCKKIFSETMSKYDAEYEKGELRANIFNIQYFVELHTVFTYIGFYKFDVEVSKEEQDMINYYEEKYCADPLSDSAD